MTSPGQASKQTPKKILVTGGAGFIGSALVRRLCADGHEVIVLDNLSRNASELPDGVTFYQGDVCRSGDVHLRAVGCDAIFHLAAINGTRNFYERPGDVLRVNIEGTQSVIHAAKLLNIPEIVFFSSSEVYQQGSTVPTPENTQLVIPDILNPRFSYGGGKLAAELLLIHSNVPKVLIIRPHNVYGPNMGFDHVLPELISKAERMGHGFIVQGTGAETRAFCHISDFIEGVMLAWQSGYTSREIYHVGVDEETSIAELLGHIKKATGNFGPTMWSGDVPEGSVSRRCPDISKLRALGYEPKVSLSEGIAEYVKWYRSQFKNDA